MRVEFYVVVSVIIYFDRLLTTNKLFWKLKAHLCRYRNVFILSKAEVYILYLNEYRLEFKGNVNIVFFLPPR